MKNFVEKGNVLNYLVPAATTITSGQFVFSGSLIGVAVTSSSTEGNVVACNLEGVFEFDKTTPLTIAQGDRLYWNAGTSKLTKTVTDRFVGYAFELAGSNATTALVLLANEGATAPQAAVVAALAGTLTGTVDGTIADVAAVSTAGGNTYADSAINTAITSINLQHKELQTTLNAVVAALKTAGLMASA